MSEEIEFINARERFAPPPRTEPKIDEAVSKVVGKPVRVSDPRLIKTVMGWKGNKPNDSTVPDDYLRNPEKIRELQKAFE